MSYVQKRTKVRIKARPESTGFIYGRLQDRVDAGLRYVVVHTPLPDGRMEGRAQYEVDEVEEVVE